LIEVYVEKIEGVWFGSAYEGEKLYATWFGPEEKGTIKGLQGILPRNSSFKKVDKPSALGNRVIAAIKGVYDGKGTSSRFQLALDHLPTYTGRVLEAVYSVPVGYATSYGLVAKAVGGGARAVGNTMAGNPFAPIVPCHRVVCSDMGLGGYGGGYEGVDNKLALLRREKRGYASRKEIPVKGGNMQVFPVELVLQKADRHK